MSELTQVAKVKQMIVVGKEDTKLGKEVGSIFVEFYSEKQAQLGVKKIKGRNYDFKEIKTAYINEDLFYDYFFTDQKRPEVDNAEKKEHNEETQV